MSTQRTSAYAPTNPQNHLLRCGYLTKQGEIIQTWRRRWFVLRTHTLAYFKEEKASKPLRIIAIGGYKVKRVLQSEFCSKPFAFVLIPTRDKYDRPFLMYSDNLTDMIEWIIELAKVTEGGVGTRIESILTGEELEFYRRLVLSRPPIKITQAPPQQTSDRPISHTDQPSSKRSTTQSLHEQDLQTHLNNSQPQTIPSKLNNSSQMASSAPPSIFQNGSIDADKGNSLKKVRKNFLGSYRKFEVPPSPTSVSAPPLLTRFDGENPWETIDLILTQQWQKIHEPQPSEQQPSPLSQSPTNDNTPAVVPIPEPTNKVSNNYAMLPSMQGPYIPSGGSVVYQPPSADQRSDGKTTTNYSSVNPSEPVSPPPSASEERSSRKLTPPNQQQQRRSKSPEIDIKKTRASIRIQQPDYFAFWTTFLTCANFTPDEAMEIALILVDNELGEAEVSELDHELLKSMGISVAKTRIRILKMKDAWVQGKKNENLPLVVEE